MSENFKLTADELLRLYINLESESEFAVNLDLLIENHALPIIEKSLTGKFQKSARSGFYWSAQDFEDLCNESCLRLVEKLAALRESKEAEKIRGFEHYAAVVAYNCWNEFFGKRAPNWKSLKNKICYAIKNHEDLEIWSESNVKFCSLICNNRKFREISADELVNRVEDEVADFRNANLSELIFEVLEKANAAVRLNELVSITARLWAIDDLPDTSLDGFWVDENLIERDQKNEFEMRVKLSQIWQEIRELPVNQRTALLYNLRDERGREMVLVFFNSKIATLREIADALDLSFEECAKILPQLPMEDKIIAERMNLTAKQVGNLRKVARENLRRRLAGKSKRKKREANPDTDKQSEGNDFDSILGENFS
jgi:hypothetical protein